MPDRFFLAATGTDLARGAGRGRVLWGGRAAVAEYAFQEPRSLPRWTLPEQSELLVLEDRVVYRDVTTGATGELRWDWPQHLRVQPGSRDSDRAATVTQVQLVCAASAGTFPALVFAGGELATVRDADRLANVLRQAIARYRVENARELGVSAPHVRMLSRLVIGPEFTNYQGGEGQTVSLPGASTVEPPTAPRRTPVHSGPADPLYGESFLTAHFTGSVPDPHANAHDLPSPAADRPGAPTGRSSGPPPRIPSTYVPPAYPVPPHPHPASAHAHPSTPPLPPPHRPRPADEASLHGASDLASRAAELAARVANFVAAEGALLGDTTPDTPPSVHRSDPVARTPQPRADRAEQIRRTAARLGNSARNRAVSQRRSTGEGTTTPASGTQHHT
jgi:hypothetical protein